MVPASRATADDAPAGSRRGPGRPPDLAKRRGVLDATLVVLAETGFAGLTIDAVAQRAGTTRLLIYRVWETKAALAADALFSSADDLVVPDHGSLRADLTDFVGQLVNRFCRPAHVMGVPGLTVELLGDPDLARDVHARYIRPAEDGFATIIERARKRGELTGAVDARNVNIVVSGMATGLSQGLRGTPAEITDLIVAALLDGVIRRT